MVCGMEHARGPAGSAAAFLRIANDDASVLA
jgi:hypothetical protein